MNKKKCYDILKVNQNASIDEIRTSYDLLYVKYKEKNLNNKLIELTYAYNYLMLNYGKVSNSSYENIDNNLIVQNKIKSFIILFLVLVIIFVGSYVGSELSFYKKNCDVSEDTHDLFLSISIDEYEDLLNGENLSIIYIGRDDCEYSNAEDIVFEEILLDYDIDVNYLDLNSLSDNDFEFLYSSYSAFVNDGIATPTIMFVQNGQVKVFKKGYTSKDDLLLLLKENNFVTE